MIKDIAHGKVLDGLRDENIRDHYFNDVLEELLKLPAEWRQNAMAEAGRRCYGTKSRPSHHNPGLPQSYSEPIEGKDFHTELPIVVDEILKQIGQKS